MVASIARWRVQTRLVCSWRAVWFSLCSVLLCTSSLWCWFYWGYGRCRLGTGLRPGPSNPFLFAAQTGRPMILTKMNQRKNSGKIIKFGNSKRAPGRVLIRRRLVLANSHGDRIWAPFSIGKTLINWIWYRFLATTVGEYLANRKNSNQLDLISFLKKGQKLLAERKAKPLFSTHSILSLLFSVSEIIEWAHSIIYSTKVIFYFS